MKKILLFLFLFVLATNTVFANTDNAFVRINLLNQDPDPANPGDYVEIRFKVEKFGNNIIEDLTFELDPKYPFYFDAIDTPIKSVGNWGGFSEDDEFYTLYYKLKVDEDAIEGTYDLDLYTYETDRESRTKSTYKIRVDENQDPNLVLGKLTSTPIKLLSDTTQNRINIEILNIGNSKAQQVLTKLVLPEGFESSYSFSTQDNLGNIEANSQKNSMFYIDIKDTVQPGSSSAMLEVSYTKDDSDELKTLEIPINLDVKSKPQFELESVNFDAEQIFPGQTVKVTFDLRNIGENTVESVSLRAFKETSQPIEFSEKSDFLGTLEKNEQGQAVLVFDVEEDATSKKYIVDVEIRSIYNDEVFIQQEQMSFFVSPKQNSFDNRNIVTIVLGVLVVILIVLLIKKK